MKYEIKCTACKRKQTTDTDTAKEYLDDGHTAYKWDCPNCGEEIIAKTFWRSKQ